MERRQYRRGPASCRGFCWENSHEVEAVTRDLSAGGAKFDGEIEGARVQWMGGDTFGVSFQNVRPTDLDELEQLIDEFEEAEGSGYA